MSLIRVNRKFRCPVCGKPDWCLVSSTGYVVICPRVESKEHLGESGYIHYFSDPVAVPKNGGNCIRRPSIDFGVLSSYYYNNLPIRQERKLAKELGVNWKVLWDFSIGWDGEAYTVPMYDEFWRIIGVQRRFPDGTKICIKGSHNGVFISCTTKRDFYQLPNILICEGFTDTVAAESLGFRAIGKFNSTCGGSILQELLIGKKVWTMTDNDPAGKKSAENLKKDLTNAQVCGIIYPEIGKDLREWIKKDNQVTNKLKQIIK